MADLPTIKAEELNKNQPCRRRSPTSLQLRHGSLTMWEINNPEDGGVTVEMIVNTLADEFRVRDGSSRRKLASRIPAGNPRCRSRTTDG